ncbi:hypothetical protein BN2476_810034 [Paraburkholderia piptadeniae]|uniref:Uncharacterized protein n=1 Tax=Paraburkholderia piptadeniae TaxID=1701573 RepID=A0A1N7SSF0_9BURK|nr:hypothetical protein BN2476_810034 [Paraburkholderia piptadeniae]
MVQRCRRSRQPPFVAGTRRCRPRSLQMDGNQHGAGFARLDHDSHLPVVLSVRLRLCLGLLLRLNLLNLRLRRHFNLLRLAV